VQYEDGGRYQCVASNTVEGGQRIVASILAELTVTCTYYRHVIYNVLHAVNACFITVVTPVLSVQSPYTIKNGLLAVSTGFPVEVQCIGIGNLTWKLSSGVIIDEDSTLDLYQEQDPISGAQTLIFQSFRHSVHGASYFCHTNFTVDEMSSPAAFVHIASCKYVWLHAKGYAAELA
jgi:hypothetical protein